MRRAWLLVLLSSSVAAPASAQPSVRLQAGSCPHLPFDPAAVERQIALELSTAGLALDASADRELSYELVPCAPGGTEFELVLRRPGFERRTPLSLAEVPLASVARALALALAEEAREALTEAPSEAPPAIPDPDPVPDPAPAPAPAPAPGPDPAPDPVPDPDPAPVPDRDPSHRPIRAGIALLARNTPDTGAFLGGARFFLDVPIADLPLLVRADVELAGGLATADLPLGSLAGGLSASLWARAADDLALRFGPRVWVGGVAWFDTGGVAQVTEIPVELGLEVRVGLDVRVAEGLELVLDAAAGTHLHGLEVVRGGARTGILGAYWGADVGLAFH